MLNLDAILENSGHFLSFQKFFIGSIAYNIPMVTKVKWSTWTQMYSYRLESKLYSLDYRNKYKFHFFIKQIKTVFSLQLKKKKDF